VRIHWTLLLSVAAMLLSAVPAGAYYFEWIGPYVTGDWTTATNWWNCETQQYGVPGANDTAAIGHGMVQIGIADVDVGSLIIGPQAHVYLIDGYTLTIHGPDPSTLDGWLEFRGVGVGGSAGHQGCRRVSYLHLAQDVTIHGSGGIVGHDCAGTYYARGVITSATLQGGPAELTLSRDDPWDERPSILGYVRIAAPLNNGGIVGVEGNQRDVLTLTTNAKTSTSDGTWRAAGNGTLSVGVAVSGGAEWIAAEDGALEINAACTSLSGGVLLDGASMEVNQNFSTLGEFEADSTNGDVTIEVAPGRTLHCGAG